MKDVEKRKDCDIKDKGKAGKLFFAGVGLALGYGGKQRSSGHRESFTASSMTCLLWKCLRGEQRCVCARIFADRYIADLCIRTLVYVTQVPCGRRRHIRNRATAKMDGYSIVFPRANWQ